MAQVTSTDFQKNPGTYQDLAQREPVLVTHHGRERSVLLSADEYHRLKRRDRIALAIEELSDEDMAAISAAEVPAEYAHLNDELDN
ncbi:MAG: type II toxin-antitoxin system Phd/YefM family antitoxin [Arenibacter algicola]|nr:type II toxin-antitoxin system Phd/YefM family antitoxin [Arenibacter algicola]